MNIGKETEQIEFKKLTGELKESVISIASMLNKHKSGVLYFGVRNDGEVIGQQIGDNTLRDVSQAIANFIKPQIIPYQKRSRQCGEISRSDKNSAADYRYYR